MNKSLKEICKEYYFEGNYNCAESIIHAANDYYNLQITPEDMKLMAGFGNGMYSGLNCGALIASIAALSKKTIKEKAHLQMQDISKADQTMVKNFKENLGGFVCSEIKPAHFNKETRCWNTVSKALDALEATMNSIE